MPNSKHEHPYAKGTAVLVPQRNHGHPYRARATVFYSERKLTEVRIASFPLGTFRSEVVPTDDLIPEVEDAEG